MGWRPCFITLRAGTDREGPSSNPIIDAAGNLYSVLSNGTFNGQIFQVAPDGTKTNPHAFAGETDGSTPIGPLH